MATVDSGTIGNKGTGNSPHSRPHPKRPKLSELLEHAPAAIAFLSGPELRCSYVNELAVRVTGRRSADELLGTTFREGLPELEESGAFEIIDEVARTGQPICRREFKVSFIPPDKGTSLEGYFDFVCQPMFDHTGAMEGIMIHAVDMTDRVLSRRALEASEARLRLAHEASHVGTWEWDPVEDSLEISAELHRMFGTDEAQVGGERFEAWVARVHPEDWPRVEEILVEAKEAGTLDFEYRYLHPEHGLRTFHTKGRRMQGSTRFFGVVLDVTEKRAAEKQIREQRERFEFATDAGQIGYWFCDLPFDKLVWDARVKEHFWLPTDTNVDISLFYERLHPDDREPTRRAIEDSIANHARYDIEYRTLSPEGKQKWIRATGRTAYDKNGKPIWFDGVTQDVTALKQTREALIRSEKLALVGRLAAAISHEINNPLEAVVNLLYLIQESSDEELVKSFSKSAQQELARVSHIVTHTLRFNRQSHKPSREKMSSLLESASAIYQPRMKDVGIAVMSDYKDTKRILCFGSELRQVFANIVANAFDASKRGGKLLLRTRDATHPRTGVRGVRVSIADTGTGMDEATCRRLFEPFFTTKGDKGTGLGLWVSGEILKKHHASLHVRSREGRGSAFSIWIPETPLQEKKTPSRSEFFCDCGGNLVALPVSSRKSYASEYHSANAPVESFKAALK
ncbi:MAG TPA: PAS domain-containing protein [Terracidiphilus sp.]|nr:PAS domain-containing protein [Terracidiphilus sp.]